MVGSGLTHWFPSAGHLFQAEGLGEGGAKWSQSSPESVSSAGCLVRLFPGLLRLDVPLEPDAWDDLDAMFGSAMRFVDTCEDVGVVSTYQLRGFVVDRNVCLV